MDIWSGLTTGSKMCVYRYGCSPNVPTQIKFCLTLNILPTMKMPEDIYNAFSLHNRIYLLAKKDKEVKPYIRVVVDNQLIQH